MCYKEGMIFVSYLTDFSFLPQERNYRKLLDTVKNDHLKGGTDGFSNIFLLLIFIYIIF